MKGFIILLKAEGYIFKMITPNEKGFIICPNCKREYTPKLKRVEGELLQVTYPDSTPEEREQLISGLCSSKCWNEFLGVGGGWDD